MVALLAIGSFAGPVQPINAELAVEVFSGKNFADLVVAIFIGKICTVYTVYIYTYIHDMTLHDIT